MPLSPPILSASLPPALGPLKEIGYAHITSPPLAPWAHDEPILIETKRPALQVEEVSYCLFYPADIASKNGGGGSSSSRVRSKGAGWVPEPFWGVVRGYERFMGDRTGMRWLASTLGVIAGRLKMPVRPLTPLLPPQGEKKYPLVIFSHGLAGTRHTYSQYCSSLASEGYVVLAIEHRDGSGPAVQYSKEHSAAAISASSTEQDGEKNNLEKQGEGRVLHYIKQGDVHWPDGDDKSLSHFRSWQVDIRVREIYETYHSFKRLLTARPSEGSAVSSSPVVNIHSQQRSDTARVSGLENDERQGWVASFVGKVDFDDLRLTGHSFGGGTVLHLLQTPSPDPDKLPALPTRQVIALDPWLEALPLPAPKTEGSPTMPPLLVLNSMGFTEWTDHFGRLVKIVREARGSLMTIIGVGHQAFSDFPLLSPTSHSSASFLLKRIHDLSTAFLRKEMLKLPDLTDGKPDEGQYEKTSDGKTMVARKSNKLGDVVIHFLGKE